MLLAAAAGDAVITGGHAENVLRGWTWDAVADNHAPNPGSGDQVRAVLLFRACIGRTTSSPGDDRGQPDGRLPPSRTPGGAEAPAPAAWVEGGLDMTPYTVMAVVAGRGRTSVPGAGTIIGRELEPTFRPFHSIPSPFLPFRSIPSVFQSIPLRQQLLKRKSDHQHKQTRLRPTQPPDYGRKARGLINWRWRNDAMVPNTRTLRHRRTARNLGGPTEDVKHVYATSQNQRSGSSDDMPHKLFTKTNSTARKTDESSHNKHHRPGWRTALSIKRSRPPDHRSCFQNKSIVPSRSTAANG